MVWTELAARDDVDVRVGALPEGMDGVTCGYDWGWLIVLSDRLGQAERRAVLAHAR